MLTVYNKHFLNCKCEWQQNEASELIGFFLLVGTVRQDDRFRPSPKFFDPRSNSGAVVKIEDALPAFP